MSGLEVNHSLKLILVEIFVLTPLFQPVYFVTIDLRCIIIIDFMCLNVVDYYDDVK